MILSENATLSLGSSPETGKVPVYNPSTKDFDLGENKNIYTSDGTIERDRTVNVNSKNLSFESGRSLNMDFSSSLNSLASAIIRVKGNNTGTGIGVFIGNVWSNLFASTGVYINAGSSGYVNGFDIIGQGVSVGGGLTGKSLGIGTGLYLNGETQNSNVQFPGVRLRGRNNGGTFDDVIIEPIGGRMSILNIPQDTASFLYGENSSGRMIKLSSTSYTTSSDVRTLISNIPVFYRGSASHSGNSSETPVGNVTISSDKWITNYKYNLTWNSTSTSQSNVIYRVYLHTSSNWYSGTPYLLARGDANGSLYSPPSSNTQFTRQIWKVGDLFESKTTFTDNSDISAGSFPFSSFSIDTSGTVYLIMTVELTDGTGNGVFTHIQIGY